MISRHAPAAVLLSLLFVLPARAQDLDARLAVQWQRFAQARQLALDTVDANAQVSRAAWEATLQPDPPWAPAELQALVWRHDALVNAARERNERASALDLTQLRRQGPAQVRAFCAQFPKGGMLHVHPFGTLSVAAVTQIFETLNPVLTPLALYRELDDPRAAGFLYPHELALLQRLHTRYGEDVRYLDLDVAERAALRAFFFLPEGRHPFNRFDACFGLMVRLFDLQKSRQAWRIMADDLFSRAAREHVRYVELSTPIPMIEAALGPLDEWAADVAARHGVTVRLLSTYSRRSPPALLHREAEALLQAPVPGLVVGINLVANETDAPALERAQSLYIPLLRAALVHATPLHRTMHAGELGDPRNPRDAMLLGAERLGHGVALRQDPVALEYARLHAIPVEANLVSNVLLGAAPSVAEHPFLYFQRLGLPVSLSTDDEGIMRTDINQECEQAINATDINYAELRAMAQASLDTAFAPDTTMQPVRAAWRADVAAFEAAWSALGN